MSDEHPLPAFNRYPMLWLAISFAAGILLNAGAHPDLTITIVFCAIFGLSAFILRRSSFATGLMLAAFIFAGAAAAMIESHISPSRVSILYDSGRIHSGDPVEVEGVLLGQPEPSIDGIFLKLASEKIMYH